MEATGFAAVPPWQACPVPAAKARRGRLQGANGDEDTHLLTPDKSCGQPQPDQTLGCPVPRARAPPPALAGREVEKLTPCQWCCQARYCQAVDPACIQPLPCQAPVYTDSHPSQMPLGAAIGAKVAVAQGKGTQGLQTSGTKRLTGFLERSLPA